MGRVNFIFFKGGSRTSKPSLFQPCVGPAADWEVKDLLEPCFDLAANQEVCSELNCQPLWFAFVSVIS